MSEKPNQGIAVSQEIGVRLQRLSAKIQSLELAFVELREQIDAILKPLLLKINALEKENSELEKKLEEKQINPKSQK